MNRVIILVPPLPRGNATPRRSSVEKVCDTAKGRTLMTRLTVLMFAILLATAPTTRADEPRSMPATPPLDPFRVDRPTASAEKRSTTPTDEPTKKLTEQEIKAMVDNLVSPNPKPSTGGDDYSLPTGFDREKQKLVRKAVGDLKGLETRIFPYLIDRWDDDHYCITVSHGLSGAYHNQSVGETCRMIIFDQIQPYGSWHGFADPAGLKLAWRPTYPNHFLASKENAKKWYKQHKNKTLFEIQLEALDWVIGEEAEDSKKYPKEERELLQKIRNDLLQSKKPITRGCYYPNEIEF
jgi:hypothetical protein